MIFAGRVVLVVMVDDVFVVAFVCHVVVPLLVHVPVAFGSIVLMDKCAVSVVFVDCAVVAALFDHVIASSVGSNAHALMMVDYNVFVVVFVVVLLYN